jgi:cytochrome c553
MRARIAAVLLAASVVAPASAGELAAGRAKAAAACQTCHGLDGMATIPNAANLSGQQKGYLVIQLKRFRSGERKHEQMGIIAKSLSDQDIEDVAEWYSSIRLAVELPQ